MSNIITSQLFDAYVDCPTKCFIQYKGETGRGNEYADWIQRNEKAYVDRYLRCSNVDQLCGTLTDNFVSASSDRHADARVYTHNLEAYLQMVERSLVPKKNRLWQFIPIRFTFKNKVSLKDRLLLAFDSYVLWKRFGQKTTQGKIIHGDDSSEVNVKVETLYAKVEKVVSGIDFLLSSGSPPPLTLNSHCAECTFQAACRKKAIELDDLSLLPGVSDTIRKELHDRGIQTITNLSFTYRPRRKPKRLRRNDEKYEYSLKALAIRDHKIYVVGSDRLETNGTPVYLDVEGIPDRDFYYLIGIRFKNGAETVQHSLWAETASKEEDIWNDFLRILATIESPVIIHYGSYEAAFLRQMIKRYGDFKPESTTAQTIMNTVNLLSFIYRRIYFPTYSNGLKDIAKHLGFNWADPNASGTQTIVWRSEWEGSNQEELKNKLVLYNAQDCEALERVADFVIRLSAGKNEPEENEVMRPVNVSDLPDGRTRIFKKIDFQNPSLEEIYRTGYRDYQREKITVRSHKRALSRVAGQDPSKTKIRDRPNRIVYWEKPNECPWCGNTKLTPHRHGDKTLLDVRFGKSGIKKWVTRYIFARYRCRACNSPMFSNLDPTWSRPQYGPNLRALAVYLNIGLRVSESKTAAIFDQLLGINIPGTVVHHFKEKAAEYYAPTHQWILDDLVGGDVVHCDETKVALGSKIGFIWAFANAEHVGYVYAPTRGGDLIQTMLKDFKGVLVSDFFSAYDSLKCSQQKCLIHLIRDLNDELMKEPFNDEIKGLTADFANLLRSIIATVDRFGLKARYLHKHKTEVARFYDKLSGRDYLTEVACKYKKRFQKNRDKLFTFLDHNNVSWNNNNAERAIKPIAHLRHDLGAVSTERGIEDYMVLLSVRETCKLQGIDFLGFLQSTETDLDEFKRNPHKRRPFLPFDSDSHFLGI